MAAASTPYKPKRLPEMENHSDIQQHIDAAFARFWHRLGKRLQAPMANQQSQPHKSGLKPTECGERYHHKGSQTARLERGTEGRGTPLRAQRLSPSKP
ncbi:Hypothetical predicted protein, partial [Pelobates cultripes]